MSIPKLAILGGTTLRGLDNLDIDSTQHPETPYGLPSSPLQLGRLCGQDIIFMSRRGDRRVAPHNINYRANIWALHEIGVRQIVGIAAVGGIRADMTPGSLAVPDQIVDYTYGREQSFFSDGHMPVKYLDFTYPYTESLRQRIIETAAANELPIIDDGTVAVRQGPRYESLAEIKLLERDGCDIVGMTVMPEVALARELDMDYATIALITNKAAGRRVAAALPEEQRDKYVKETVQKVQLLLEAMVSTD